MTRKTDYTWEDVGDKIKADGSATTQAEKEVIAKEWNDANAVNGKLDQVDAQRHRATRDALLAECDWTQLDDVPQTTKDKYKSYRQELRDLPQHPDFPHITMPSEPE